jgi:hypothetical protein
LIERMATSQLGQELTCVAQQNRYWNAAIVKLCKTARRGDARSFDFDYP